MEKLFRDDNLELEVPKFIYEGSDRAKFERWVGSVFNRAGKTINKNTISLARAFLSAIDYDDIIHKFVSREYKTGELFFYNDFLYECVRDTKAHRSPEDSEFFRVVTFSKNRVYQPGEYCFYNFIKYFCIKESLNEDPSSSENFIPFFNVKSLKYFMSLASVLSGGLSVPYSDGVRYNKSTIVSFNKKNYVALVDTHSIPGTVDSEDWALFSLNGVALTADSVLYDNPDHPELDNVEKALNKLLYSPIRISVSLSKSVAEIGSIVEKLTISWNTTKVPTTIQTNFSTNIEVTDRTFVVKNVSENKSFSVTVDDGTTRTSSSASIQFLPRKFWGSSSNPTITQDVIASLSSELSSTRNMTRTMSANNSFLVFAYPARFGKASFKVNGLNSTAWEESSVSFTNSFNHTESYLVYRSTYKQSGSGIQVILA